MREGLRSSSKLPVKADKNEALPSEEAAKLEVNTAEVTDFGLSDQKVPKLIDSVAEEEKMVSVSEEEMNGSKHEECGVGSDIGKDNTAECSSHKRKGTTVDSKIESEDDSVKRQKLRGQVVDTKSQVVGRVLRSMSAAKSDCMENNEKGQINGEFVAERMRGKVGSEEKRIEVDKEESDHCHAEYSCHSDNVVNKKVVRGRGRPPKSREIDEFPKNLDDIAKKEMDKFAGQESHLLNSRPSKKVKRKRGRPRKYQKSDEFQKKRSDAKKVEINQSIGQESYQCSNNASKKVKRKRGRPRKVQHCDGSDEKLGSMKNEGIDLSASQESHQPNNEEINKLKPRRGRPPKAQQSNRSEKKRAEVEEEAYDWAFGVQSDQPDNEASEHSKDNLGKPAKLNKGKKVGALRKKKKRTSKHNIHDMGHKVGKNSSVSGKRLLDKEYNMKLPPTKKMKSSNAKQRTGETTHSRSERQAVRDKIVDLLLGAGWEIQHRPRNGREYMDAVYVNPEGRTHWSVTLAYRVLKKHYEDGGGDSKSHNSSFKFTPIPEEELNILTKVMVKQRSDKNKKKRKWIPGEKGQKTAGAIKKKKWKLHKRKLDAMAGVSHKMLKGRKNPKTLSGKQDDLASVSDDGTTVSARGRKRFETHGRKRCSLMARKSQDGTESDKDGYVLYNGKRTVLAWMINQGSVPLDGKVQYLKRRKTQGVMKGRITINGIQCDCCGKTFGNAEFEAHAGGKSCRPLKNIYLENGLSLLQCQLDSWNREGESVHKAFHFVDIDGEDPNDDTCGICGDGGNLICCDSCPSTFHQSCLEIRKFPRGLWHCIYCLCKFCGTVGGNTCQIDDNKAALSHVLLTCCLCEEKYHQPCVQEKDIINADPGNPSFCGKNCQELYKRLQMLFGVKHELEEGFSWTFVRRFDVGSDISLNGMPQKVDCNSKVAVALQIMDECFVPMVDHRSGVNLIRNIVYSFGSNFNRLNYSGFFTAILERADEMIAAASIRIHGNRLAEMPFIGTRYSYRRQGMCRRLLRAIEMALCSMNVEKLVIPAISELTETWTSVFGFGPLEGSDKQVLRNMNMMVFPGVDMLQKPLLKHQFTEENMLPIEGSISTELEELQSLEEMTNNFDESCSSGFDLNVSTETGVPHTGNKMNEHVAVESSSVYDVCSNFLSDAPTQNAGGKKSVDQSDAITSHLDVRNRIVNPADSSCREQIGDEMLNNSEKKCLTEFDLKASDEIGVTLACNMIGRTTAAGPGLLHPNGYFNEMIGLTAQDVIDKKCHVRLGLISENVKRLDSLVNNTVEIISFQSQESVSEHGTKVSDLNAAPCEPKSADISHNEVQSTSPRAHNRAQAHVNSGFAAMPIEQNLSSMGNNAHQMPLEHTSGSCSVSVGSGYDLNELPTTAENGTISSDGCLVSDRTHINTKISKEPGVDSESDHANVIQSNSVTTCSSGSAPGVALHCASGGGSSHGAMILSNRAN